VNPNVKQAALSVFVLLNAGAILSWAMPPLIPALQKVNSFTRPYMVISGLSQKWNLFAPNTYTENVYVNAEITFQNGQTKLWAPQRPVMLGYIARYLKAHYRKFLDERLPFHAHVWPDAARYIARLYRNETSPPKIVRLIQHSLPIPGPFQSVLTELPAPTSKVLFVYSVLPSDLR
jgi:hypothetical protein